MSRLIDVHNDLCPPDWMAYLEKRTEHPRLVRTGADSWAFYWEGISMAHLRRAGHYDPQARLEDMDRFGTDVQMVSLTGTGLECLPAGEGAAWASRVNDYFAGVCRQYPGRFYAYAALPYQDADASVRELDRAYKHLGVKGILMFSNINGKSIAAPEFHPLYARAEEYGLPVFVHPAVPLTAEVMKKVGLPLPLFGFTLDTTMAVVSLIFQGVLEKYPGLKIIHAHLGGVVPYLAQRMDDNFKGHAEQWGFSLPHPPSLYYRRQVYIDSISFNPPAMRCALEFAGVERVLFGSDYPHLARDPAQAADSVRNLGLPEKDTRDILGGNSAALFGLEA